jgi:hypothetical protein
VAYRVVTIARLSDRPIKRSTASLECTIFPISPPLIQLPIDLSHDAQIELALAEIGKEKALGYAYYARKYVLDRSTLSQYYKRDSECNSRAI